MAARRSRAKPRPLPAVSPFEETTTSMSAEQLEALRDESERPTIRLPARPPSAPPDPPVREEVTRQARVLVGPDGVARVLDAYALEEETVPGISPKDLLAKSKARKGKTKRR